MQVGVEELLAVVRPWAARHGFEARAIVTAGDDRPRLAIDTARRIAFEVYALDAFGNVGVDLDAPGVRRAHTGPWPELVRLLDEAREELERPPFLRPNDLS